MASLGTIYAELRLKLDDFKKDIATVKDDLEKASNDTKESMEGMTDLGKGMQKAGKGMTKYVTGPIMALGTAAVYTGMQFDTAMSEVQAISGATGSEFDALREQARDLGGTTKFTASEAAEGMTMLARAGFKTSEIMAAMPGMLNLAAAGNLDLGLAADLVSDTMMAFGENADQAGRYADVFAKAAASGNTTVAGLGEAMSYGASSAAAMGMSVEETAAIMTAFADAGIKSSRAGTTYEAVMRDLRKSAIDAGGELKYLTQTGEEVSVAWYDAEGNARPFLDVLGDLETSLEGASTEQRDFAMSQLVQSKAMRGMNILMSRGSESLGELTDSLYTAGGSADEMSDTMLNNLAGSMTILKSAISEIMIGFSDVLAPALKVAAEKLQELAVWFGKLSPATKKTIVIVLAIVAAIGPLLLIFGTILVMIPNMVAGFGILAGAFGAISLPVIAVIAAIAAVIAIGVYLYKNWDKVTEAAKNFGNAVKEWVLGAVDKVKEKFAEWKESMAELGKKIGDWISDTVTWFAELPGRIADAVVTFFTVTLAGWFSEAFDKIKTTVSTGIDNVVTFFSELPGRVQAFLYDLFFVKIPYWVGFGLGTMVRIVSESITNVVTWFQELPGKIETFMLALVEKISIAVNNIAQWFSELPGRILAYMTAVVENIRITIDSIVTWFAGLPERIWVWLQATWTKINEWGLNVWTTMTTWISTTLAAVIEWMSGLPERIWTWLVNTVTKVTNFAVEAKNEMVAAGTGMLTGFIDTIKGIPDMVWEIMTNIGSKITDAATNLKNAATTAASNLWQGFKNGLGIHSPSYIEDAMTNILAKTKAGTQQLKHDMASFENTMKEPVKLMTTGGVDAILGRPQPRTEENAGTGGASYNVVVNNPKPEPASDSIRTTLLKHSYGLT